MSYQLQRLVPISARRSTHVFRPQIGFLQLTECFLDVSWPDRGTCFFRRVKQSRFTSLAFVSSLIISVCGRVIVATITRAASFLVISVLLAPALTHRVLSNFDPERLLGQSLDNLEAQEP